MENLSSVILPVSKMSNAFSSIFGGSGDTDYSTVNLLSLQMKMLENLSLKIDVIQSGIEFIIENEIEIIKLLKDLPNNVVSELYKSNLQGLFEAVQEDIRTYLDDRQNDEKTANNIHQPIFKKNAEMLKKARTEITGLNNYLHLPLISTCFHFEMFCSVLGKLSKTSIKSKLNSYKKWIEGHLNNSLIKNLDKYRFERAALIAVSKNLEVDKKFYTYWRKTTGGGPIFGTHIDPKTGEYPYLGEEDYKVEFNKFDFKLSVNISAELAENTTLLIDRSILRGDELPSVFIVGDFIVPATYRFKSKYANDTYKPLNIEGRLLIDESQKDLSTIYTLAPKITDEINSLLPAINDNSNKLILYASLINIANESLLIINRFLSEPQQLNENTVLSFGLELENVSRIQNERALQWIKFIDDKADQIEDLDKKNKIIKLKDEMANLQANSKDILLRYKQLEEDIANNLPKELLVIILGALEHFGKEIEKGVQNLGKETEIFVQNLGKNIEKAGQDIGENTEKAIQDIGKNAEKAVQDVGIAAEAAVNYAEHQIKSLGKTLKDAEERVREGKIIDAVWHLGIDPAEHTEENFATAVQKSSLLNNIATAAASIYGGPGGAAAYAAWFTYKQTRNFDFALKAGIIAGLTSQGISFANGISSLNVTDLAKRTLVTSAIGAMSIAASGGSEKDIIEGFLKGSALSIAREAYRSETFYEIEGKAPTEPAIPKLNEDYIKNKYISLLYDDDKPLFKSVFDPATNETQIIRLYSVTDLPRNISMVGLESSTLGDGFFSGSETSVPMQAIAKLPYANDMAYLHDAWCEKVGKMGYELNLGETIVTIIPATIVTVAGSETPIATQIIEELNKKAIN